LFETFDCVYFQRSCNVTDLERVNLLQEQIASTLLNPHNMRDLNCIPPDQHDQGWRAPAQYGHVDEVKKSDASTDVNDSKMPMIFFDSMKHITFNVFYCLLFVDSETPSE